MLYWFGWFGFSYFGYFVIYPLEISSTKWKDIHIFVINYYFCLKYGIGFSYFIIFIRIYGGILGYVKKKN